MITQSIRREANWLDEINWRLHVAVAAKLRRQPALLGIALQNLRHWRRQADPHQLAGWREWQLILVTWPPEQITEFVATRSPEADRLRRQSPFCGVLTSAEQSQALLGLAAGSSAAAPPGWMAERRSAAPGPALREGGNPG